MIFTWANVFFVDPDKLVPVRPALLVPAPQGMEDLVNDDPFKLASVSDGDVLRTTDATDKREAAVCGVENIE